MSIKSSKRDNLSSEEMLKLYQDMLLIRLFEERAGQLYNMGFIGGFCHLYIGQEAVVTGFHAVRKNQDTMITSYRDHGQMLVLGMDPKKIMAELTGRAPGYSKGKGGSMHMFSKDNGFYGGHGIVGAQVPLGGGLAFKHQYSQDNGVCFTFTGDGAANQGQVYETLNMAALWKLPFILIIENNEYAMGTPTQRGSASAVFHKRADSYGIPNELVDGMDVLAVKDVAQRAADHARSGKGPYVIECKTYRYRGHSMSDPAQYRTKEELQNYKDNKDPLVNLEKIILTLDSNHEKKIKKIKETITKIVKDAVEFAKTAPEPLAEELFTDILVG